MGGYYEVEKVVIRYPVILYLQAVVVPAGSQFGNSIPPRKKKYPPPFFFQGTVIPKTSSFSKRPVRLLVAMTTDTDT